MGIVVQPNSSSAGSSRAKGKRKAVEVEKHITFAETPSDRELALVRMQKPPLTPVETIRAGPSTVKPKNEPVEVVDLGWEEEDAGKRKAKSQLAEVGQEADDTDEAVDAEQAQVSLPFHLFVRMCLQEMMAERTATPAGPVRRPLCPTGPGPRAAHSRAETRLDAWIVRQGSRAESEESRMGRGRVGT